MYGCQFSNNSSCIDYVHILRARSRRGPVSIVNQLVDKSSYVDQSSMPDPFLLWNIFQSVKDGGIILNCLTLHCGPLPTEDHHSLWTSSVDNPYFHSTIATVDHSTCLGPAAESVRGVWPVGGGAGRRLAARGRRTGTNGRQSLRAAGHCADPPTVSAVC